MAQETSRYLGWWLYTHPSEKYEFVNWDDDIPNIWENKIDGNQTTNQKSIQKTVTLLYRMVDRDSLFMVDVFITTTKPPSRLS